MQNENNNTFEQKRQKFLKEENRYSKMSSRISAWRGITFFIGVPLLIMGIVDNILLCTIIGILLVGVFFGLIKCHEIVTERLSFNIACKESCDRYLARFNNDWHQFADDGRDYVMESDTALWDLDLFGKASLYQLISVCHTKAGKRKLADAIKLKNNEIDIVQINKAVEELSKDIDGAIAFEAVGIKNGKRKKNTNIEAFVGYCVSEEEKEIPAWAKMLSIILPIIEISFLVLAIIQILPIGFPVAGFVALIGFSELTLNITDDMVLPLCTMSRMVDDYMGFMEEIDNSDYKAELLATIKNHISSDRGGLVAYRRLKTISAAYNVVFNPLIYNVLNGFFLWNFRLAEISISWKRKYAKGAGEALISIADMEMLRSFATLALVRETSFAHIKYNDKAYLSGEEMYHPLLNTESVVANDADFKNGIVIITGSNMSGKTTYLRTIAVNLYLAYMGAPICAKALEAGYMKIFTSMRVTDDVANGISTFYAEILRIKAMSEYRKEDKPMLCLIDEIFKGTNSADRIVGAKEVIRSLSGDKCMVMVSTHDFELCDLKDKNNCVADNFHFEEYYEEDKLMFDYRIKNGRCTTTNAREILKMAGFDLN